MRLAGRDARLGKPALLGLAGTLALVCVAAAPPGAPAGSIEGAAGGAPLAATQGARGAVSENLVFQDLPVVITASRHEQKASEAPASVAVVTSEQIERYGYRTLAQALESVPGLFINYDHNYTYVGVRGYARTGDYNSRVQIQVNGHPLNDNIWDYAGVGEDFGVDMSMVERIEVVYGPGSALYGSNAVLATINVITKVPESVGGTGVGLEGGSFGRGKARIEHGGGGGAWKIAGSLGLLNVKGADLYFPEYDALGLNGGVADGTDFERASQIYGRAVRGSLSIQAMSVYRDKGVPTGAYGTVFNDDASRTTDVRSFLEARYRCSLREGLDLSLRGAYDEYRYWATYRYDAGGGVLIDNIDQSTGRWLSQEAQLDYRPTPRHRLILGQGFVTNFKAHMENFDEDPHVKYVDVGTTYNEYSVYAQDEYAPAKDWHPTTGLRYDDYSSFGSALSPRFALVFAPRDTWRLKLVAGQAFRAPNIYELRYESFTWLANPSLKPETVNSYELAWESAVAPRLDLRLALYHDRISDLITLVQVSPGLNQFLNVDRAITEGGELALRVRFGRGLGGYFSYSYMKGEDGDGNQLANYPPQSWKAGVSMPFGEERWRLSADVQFYEQRLTLAGTQGPDVFLTNVTLLAPLLHSRARLSASIYNLFDRQYGLPASADTPSLGLIPQDGRSFLLRVLCRF